MFKVSTATQFSFFLVFYEIASYLSNDAYLPAMPGIAYDLFTTEKLVLLTFTAWFLGSVIVQPFLGPLSDRYGRRPILLIGGIFFILSNLLCMLATNITFLIFARLMQGMTVPSMIIAGYAAIHESFEREKAIQILARMNTITIIAPALGPLLGALILSFSHWRSIFILLAVWGGLAIILLFFKMPETLPFEKREKSLHIKNILRQYQTVISNATFMRYLLTACFLVGGLIVWMVAGTFLVTQTFGHSVIYFGCAQAIIFGCFIIGTTLVKKYMKNDNIHQFITTGVLCSIAGGIIASSLGYVFPMFLYGMLIAIMLATLGAGLCFPVLVRLAVESSEAPMGIRMTIVSGTQMASVVLCSSLMSTFYNDTLLSLGLIVLLLAVAAFFIKPHRSSIDNS